MAQQQMSSSQKALMLELKSLQEEPVEGFRITLVDESDLYNWEVAIFGPPNTLYEGGYFKVRPCGRAGPPAAAVVLRRRRRGLRRPPWPRTGPLCRARRAPGGAAGPGPRSDPRVPRGSGEGTRRFGARRCCPSPPAAGGGGRAGRGLQELPWAWGRPGERGPRRAAVVFLV